MLKNIIMISHDKKKWCFEQHEKTNHYYSEYLPYKFHLEMVANVFKQFSYLLDNELDYYTNQPILSIKPDEHPITLRGACEIACYAHDIIEDTRNTFNDVKLVLGLEVAEIVYALTNEKGKNRKERANDKYYVGIRNTKGATFVKLCDRIANVQFGKLTKTRQFEMYLKENDEFIEKLGYSPMGFHELKPMFEYLIELLNS